MEETCDVCGGPVFEPAIGQPVSHDIVKVACDEKPEKGCWFWTEIVFTN